MKGRNILITIGIILVVFHLLSLFGASDKNGGEISDMSKQESIGYFIGRNFLLFIGIILLVIAWFIDKKVKKNRRKNIIDSFLNKN